jgi:hypothetical protein
MQTFLPHTDFKKSLQSLDYKRLGKQRVETHQLLNVLLNRTKTKGWRNHPICKMWKGYENALKLYFNLSLDEWIGRGYNNTMKKEKIVGKVIMPVWWGNKEFHSSHKANLLRKDFDFYSKYGWSENPANPYVWFDTDKKMFYEHIVKTNQKHYLN